MRDEATALVHYRMAVQGEDWVAANAFAESARLHGCWCEEMVLRTPRGHPLEAEVQDIVLESIDRLRDEVMEMGDE